MELQIKTTMIWENSNSENQLEQTITVNGEDVLDLIYELDKEIFEKFDNNIDVHQRIFEIQYLSEPEIMSEFYNEFVYFAGQTYHFDLIINDKLTFFLSPEQLAYHNGDSDFEYGHSIYNEREKMKNKPKNWKSPWLPQL